MLLAESAIKLMLLAATCVHTANSVSSNSHLSLVSCSDIALEVECELRHWDTHC
jgi:hypothetical protein